MLMTPNSRDDEDNQEQLEPRVSGEMIFEALLDKGAVRPDGTCVPRLEQPEASVPEASSSARNSSGSVLLPEPCTRFSPAVDVICR